MEKNSHLKLTLVMLFLAIIMQLTPVTGNWLMWKPNFLMLVMIAWILYFPEKFGIEFSAMVGICADLVFGTTLGVHVLLFIICGAVVRLLHRVIAYLSLWHRIVAVGLLVIFIELLRIVAGAWVNMPIFWEHMPYMALFSSLFWMPLDKLVGRIYRLQN